MAKEKAEKKVVKKVTKPEKVKFDYAVEIESSGVSFKEEGNDIYELLKDFPAPALLNTETNIKVTKGTKEVRRDLKVSDARRCFNGSETTALELLSISITKQLG